MDSKCEMRTLEIPSLAKLTGTGMYPADCGMAVFEQLICHHSAQALMLEVSPTAKSFTAFVILDLDPTAQLDRYRAKKKKKRIKKKDSDPADL